MVGISNSTSVDILVVCSLMKTRCKTGYTSYYTLRMSVFCGLGILSPWLQCLISVFLDYFIIRSFPMVILLLLLEAFLWLFYYYKYSFGYSIIRSFPLLISLLEAFLRLFNF